jgi:hypothetical protein
MPAPLVQLLIDAEPAAPRLVDRIRRIEVRESDEDPTVAAVRLQLAQQPSGSFFPLDDEVFTAGTRIGVEIAAPGGLLQRLFEGVVTHVRPHFEAIESNCYVEILAMDPAVLLNASERTASYPDASDAEAAEEILSRYNIRAVVDETSDRHKSEYQLLVQRATDWQFLRFLAQRNGFVCYFEYDTIAGEMVGHFKKRPLAEDPQADLTILQDGANLTWLDLQWVLTGPVRWTAAAIDPIRKRLVSSDGAASAEALGEEGLGDLLERGLRENGAEGAVRLLRSPRPTDPGIRAAGTGMTDASRFAIEARGEVDPSLYRGLLRARRPALIRGAGSRMSGLYYVRTVRTAIDEGEISQTFIAERNALGQTGREEFGRSAEEVEPQ